MPDIARNPALLRRRRLRRTAYASVLGILLIGVSIVLARIEPAAPAVPAAALVRDTVKRGSFVRTVRGSGTLVPEDSRWIPAITDGRVERILLHPGAAVEADSIVLELSNPQVEQEALNARLQLQSAPAQLEQLRFQYQNELLTLESQIAALDADHEQARIEAETKDALAKRQLVSEIDRRQAQLRADTLAKRARIEHERVAATRESLDARLGVPRAARLAQDTGFDPAFKRSQDSDFMVRALYERHYALSPRVLYAYSKSGASARRTHRRPAAVAPSTRRLDRCSPTDGS